MTTDLASSSQGVVWATVFLTALDLFGIATIVFLDLKNPAIFEPVAVTLSAIGSFSQIVAPIGSAVTTGEVSASIVTVRLVATLHVPVTTQW